MMHGFFGRANQADVEAAKSMANCDFPHWGLTLGHGDLDLDGYPLLDMFWVFSGQNG